MNRFVRLGVKIFAGCVAAVLLVFIGISIWPIRTTTIASSPTYGVTFSRIYAERELGISADDVLREALDDLGVRRFRIPAYWELIQPTTSTEWDFRVLDRDVAEIAARQGKIVLAVGQKLPRWPECWLPEWIRGAPDADRQRALLNHLRTLIEHYRDEAAVIAWQVENESNLPFGVCPKPNKELFRQEVALVRELDPTRPIQTTESGELSLWTAFRHDVDGLGVSVYRIVTNPYIGPIHYWFFTPNFFFRKAAFVKYLGLKSLYISELQMEPWADRKLSEEPLANQLKAFPVDQMEEHAAFAVASRLNPVDLWGVEWWYWMKTQQQHPEYWEAARRIFRGASER